jgi:hypothetical protein
MALVTHRLTDHEPPLLGPAERAALVALARWLNGVQTPDAIDPDVLSQVAASARRHTGLSPAELDDRPAREVESLAAGGPTVTARSAPGAAIGPEAALAPARTTAAPAAPTALPEPALAADDGVTRVVILPDPPRQPGAPEAPDAPEAPAPVERPQPPVVEEKSLPAGRPPALVGLSTDVGREAEDLPFLAAAAPYLPAARPIAPPPVHRSVDQAAATAAPRPQAESTGATERGVPAHRVAPVHLPRVRDSRGHRPLADQPVPVRQTTAGTPLDLDAIAAALTERLDRAAADLGLDPED